jgi:hypothetical protein
MGLLDETLRQVTGGDAPAADVHAAYARVAGTVPPSDLADGLAHAFKSDQTPPFEQMVSGLFGQSNSDQKAGLLNQILGAFGPGGAAQVLGAAGGPAGLASILSEGRVTPEQAQQVPPEVVQALAQEAATSDPSIVETAAGFYAQHPTLIKAIGAGALALMMSRISAGRR